MDPAEIAVLPAVRRARSLLHAHDADTVREQMAIAAIPAPSGEEAERGRFVRARFEEIGLADVSTDAAGNVLARLPGGSGDGQPAVVSAHLDTVFPAGTEVSPRRSGSRILAPGITDNSRGLAALLALARVLVEAGIHTRLPLWFAATVGEEGRGDLRGVKHLFRPDSPFAAAAAFVSLDGSGLRRVVNRGIGSRRLRATLRGPGGHSWSDFGLPNPIHALGTAVARIRRIPLPASPPSTLTVARIGGGTSVNAIPDEAWLEVDIRSADAGALRRIEAEVRKELERAAAEEDPRGHPRAPRLSLEIEVIGDRPSGAVEETHPLVRAALAATRAIGQQAELVASSTDANVPIALGIPAVTIGAGGVCGGVHTTAEWYENRDGARGLERALLLVLAAAGTG